MSELRTIDFILFSFSSFFLFSCYFFSFSLCYDFKLCAVMNLKSLGSDNRTTLVLSNTRELDRDPFTK